MPYSASKVVTINHLKVPNTNQANFPVLFSGTYPYLATVANGGVVTNANGYDIIFTSDSAGTTQLDHEIESYNATTGAVNFWVRVPTVATATDTVIYLFYGNSAITTSQENKPGVWNINFKVVWHLPNGTTLTANDSTSNANNGTIAGPTATTGKIDGGASYTANANKISSGASIVSISTYTYETWVKYSSVTGGGNDAIFTQPTNNPSIFRWTDNKLYVYGNGAQQVVSIATYGDTNWHYVVITASGSTLTLYVDGASQGTPATFSTASTAGVVYLGDNGLGTDTFSGVLDEFRVSNTARSADWITTSYNNQSSPSTFYTLTQNGAQVVPGTVAGIASVSTTLSAPAIVAPGAVSGIASTTATVIAPALFQPTSAGIATVAAEVSTTGFITAEFPAGITTTTVLLRSPTKLEISTAIGTAATSTTLSTQSLLGMGAISGIATALATVTSSGSTLDPSSVTGIASVLGQVTTTAIIAPNPVNSPTATTAVLATQQLFTVSSSGTATATATLTSITVVIPSTVESAASTTAILSAPISFTVGTTGLAATSCAIATTARLTLGTIASAATPIVILSVAHNLDLSLVLGSTSTSSTISTSVTLVLSQSLGLASTLNIPLHHRIHRSARLIGPTRSAVAKLTTVP